MDLDALKRRVEGVGLSASDVVRMMGGRVVLTQASRWLRDWSFSASTFELLRRLCDEKELEGGTGICGKVDFKKPDGGAFKGSVADAIRIDEVGTVEAVVPLPDVFDTDKKVSGHSDEFPMVNGVPNKWGVIEADEVVSDEVSEVSLSPHSLGMMSEHPEEMVWWKESLFAYFHFWEGVCGRVPWAEVKDHADYVVRLGDDSRLFSEFTKK